MSSPQLLQPTELSAVAEALAHAGSASSATEVLKELRAPGREVAIGSVELDSLVAMRAKVQTLECALSTLVSGLVEWRGKVAARYRDFPANIGTRLNTLLEKIVSTDRLDEHTVIKINSSSAAQFRSEYAGICEDVAQAIMRADRNWRRGWRDFLRAVRVLPAHNVLHYLDPTLLEGLGTVRTLVSQAGEALTGVLPVVPKTSAARTAVEKFLKAEEGLRRGLCLGDVLINNYAELQDKTFKGRILPLPLFVPIPCPKLGFIVWPIFVSPNHRTFGNLVLHGAGPLVLARELCDENMIAPLQDCASKMKIDLDARIKVEEGRAAVRREKQESAAAQALLARFLESTQGLVYSYQKPELLSAQLGGWSAQDTRLFVLDALRQLPLGEVQTAQEEVIASGMANSAADLPLPVLDAEVGALATTCRISHETLLEWRATRSVVTIRSTTESYRRSRSTADSGVASATSIPCWPEIWGMQPVERVAHVRAVERFLDQVNQGPEPLRSVYTLSADAERFSPSRLEATQEEHRVAALAVAIGHHNAWAWKIEVLPSHIDWHLAASRMTQLVAGFEQHMDDGRIARLIVAATPDWLTMDEPSFDDYVPRAAAAALELSTVAGAGSFEEIALAVLPGEALYSAELRIEESEVSRLRLKYGYQEIPKAPCSLKTARLREAAVIAVLGYLPGVSPDRQREIGERVLTRFPALLFEQNPLCLEATGNGDSFTAYVAQLRKIARGLERSAVTVMGIDGLASYFLPTNASAARPS